MSRSKRCAQTEVFNELLLDVRVNYREEHKQNFRYKFFNAEINFKKKKISHRTIFSILFKADSQRYAIFFTFFF